MPKSTAVAVPADTADVLSPEDLALLQAQQESEFDSDLITTPILKIGQPLTKEVTDGDAESGEFINTATGEGIGKEVEFVVAFYQKGRFAVDRATNRAFVSVGSSTIPENWRDLVGDEFVGTPFDEYPDAEEEYKNRVNRKDIEWGHGPLVSTTHNFTGLALVKDPETEETEPQPVRLSLQRTNVPSVKKWMTLKASKLRNRPFWEKTFVLSTFPKQFSRGTAHLLDVKVGRDTTTDEKQEAATLAQVIAAGLVVDNSVEAGNDAPTAPDAKGGLAV